MSNWLEKWRGDDKSLSPERRAMQEALSRLEQGTKAAPPVEKPTGRLAFALDLTASRSRSLRSARAATAEMFDTIAEIGSISVKLIYFRGEDECRAGGWENNPARVSRAMQRLSCEGGPTQIGRALRHVLDEKESASGVVFIGDHCEDDQAELARVAARLGERGIPVFVFHECKDSDASSIAAKPIFKNVAAASGGVYCEFSPESAAALRELISNVAAFSAAGIEGIKQAAAAQTAEGQLLQKRLLLLAAPGTVTTRRPRS